MSAYELFLKVHTISKGDNKISTHTRIGDKNAKIYGGNYHIPDEKYEEFMKLYFNTIYTKNKKEFLTEAQLENGVLAIDIDFRFPFETTERYITKTHIDKFINVLLVEIEKYLNLVEMRNFHSLSFKNRTLTEWRKKILPKTDYI